ncbi:Murein DD-endopeptidase MepM and murein hydrolase activator NlpD, contain LysM domain [Lysobacter spongiicola DSM 21749]|uniref:Murein DD-endopeptidase MepM and murein hydrolase activator NlpD, contain LysM domain n=1 Tax=Lysobacter spongiicola DSM 21749 TaxID=1122188 RepID=A0A1T4QNT5_9GAMM|nr:Murein DD-endopeptidase MepM and murein hydrolase activator NlpD, contain LysM domain [Lysobacter spongiicola DSM 21749]
MLRLVLVFLVGVLVGANLVYFTLTRDRADPEAVVVFERERTQHALPADTADAPANRVDPAPADTAPEPRATAPRQNTPAPAGTRRGVPAPGAVASPSGLVVPVQGVTPAELSNTFDDARGQGRVHEALDIMAPRGTPVLAVADGAIEKLFASERGGLTIYQFEPTGRHAYYYAHLDRYAQGLSDGNEVKRGQVIGYVGSTGNASDDAPHLHFAIFELGPEKNWWEGTAINPYPVLTGARPL